MKDKWGWENYIIINFLNSIYNLTKKTTNVIVVQIRQTWQIRRNHYTGLNLFIMPITHIDKKMSYIGREIFCWIGIQNLMLYTQKYTPPNCNSFCWECTYIATERNSSIAEPSSKCIKSRWNEKTKREI